MRLSGPTTPRFGLLYQVINPSRKRFEQGTSGHVIGIKDTDIEPMGAVTLFEAFQKSGKHPVLLEPDMVMTSTFHHFITRQWQLLQRKFTEQRHGVKVSSHFQDMEKRLDQFLELEHKAYPVYLVQDAAGRLQWSVPHQIERGNLIIAPHAEIFEALKLQNPNYESPPRS